MDKIENQIRHVTSEPMVTFSQLGGTFPKCPPIDPTERCSLWVTDFDLGGDVRSGMLMFPGEHCAYQLIGKYDQEYTIRHQYAVLRLSPEQLVEELTWHEQHRERVEGGKTIDWIIEDYRKRKKPDYSACEVIGWFEV